VPARKFNSCTTRTSLSCCQHCSFPQLRIRWIRKLSSPFDCESSSQKYRWLDRPTYSSFTGWILLHEMGFQQRTCRRWPYPGIIVRVRAQALVGTESRSFHLPGRGTGVRGRKPSFASSCHPKEVLERFSFPLRRMLRLCSLVSSTSLGRVFSESYPLVAMHTFDCKHVSVSIRWSRGGIVFRVVFAWIVGADDATGSDEAMATCSSPGQEAESPSVQGKKKGKLYSTTAQSALRISSALETVNAPPSSRLSSFTTPSSTSMA